MGQRHFKLRLVGISGFGPVLRTPLCHEGSPNLKQSNVPLLYRPSIGGGLQQTPYPLALDITSCGKYISHQKASRLVIKHVPGLLTFTIVPLAIFYWK